MKNNTKIDSIFQKNSSVFLIAEIGINHNGSIENVKKMINLAYLSGFDAVKLQKRDPSICVPENQKNIMRDTPWGEMTYLEYRYKVEFSEKDYYEIETYCNKIGIILLASPWDLPSAEFLIELGMPAIKVPSALLTNQDLLSFLASQNLPIFISTGMSTINEINEAIKILKKTKLVVMHCTSTYPCPIEELNLNVIREFKEKYNYPIGYSGHEEGIAPSYAAVALGIKVLERHITLDREMWGSDQKASIEPTGMFRFVRDIRNIEKALGDGIKKVYPSEEKIKLKLRY